MKRSKLLEAQVQQVRPIKLVKMTRRIKMRMVPKKVKPNKKRVQLVVNLLKTLSKFFYILLRESMVDMVHL